jgi:hypothetical protein
MSGSRIEIPVWGLKLLATGMTGYRENRSKTGLNSNFKFENAEIGYWAVLPVPKSVNRSKNGLNLNFKIWKKKWRKSLGEPRTMKLKDWSWGKLWTSNHKLKSGYEQQHTKNQSKFQENRAVFTSTNFADRVASIFLILFWANLLKSSLVFLEFFILIFFKYFKIFKFTGWFTKTNETSPNRFL